MQNQGADWGEVGTKLADESFRVEYVQAFKNAKKSHSKLILFAPGSR